MVDRPLEAKNVQIATVTPHGGSEARRVAEDRQQEWPGPGLFHSLNFGSARPSFYYLA